MHRDLIREAEIAEDELLQLPQLRGEMACVADPDACGDDDEDDYDNNNDEDLPDTLPEPITLQSPPSQSQKP